MFKARVLRRYPSPTPTQIATSSTAFNPCTRRDHTSHVHVDLIAAVQPHYDADLRQVIVFGGLRLAPAAPLRNFARAVTQRAALFLPLPTRSAAACTHAPPSTTHAELLSSHSPRQRLTPLTQPPIVATSRAFVIHPLPRLTSPRHRAFSLGP